MNEELIKLILSVSGEDAIADLTAKLNDNQAALESLTQSFLAGDTTTEEYFKTQKKLGADAKQLQSALEGLTAAIKAQAAADDLAAGEAYDLADAYELVDQEVRDATKSSVIFARATKDESESLEDMTVRLKAARTATDSLADSKSKTATNAALAARGVLGFSRAAEDFATGGFIGVLNNIPEMTNAAGQAFRLSTASIAAWTAGISLAATGVYSLWRNWSQIEEFFGKGVPRPILDSTAELKQKLEDAEKITDELGKKTKLSLDELARYKQATEDVKNFNAKLKDQADLQALLDEKSESTQKHASAFRKAFAESGPQEALGNLQSAIFDKADAKGKVFNTVRGAMSTPEEYAQDLVRAGSKGDVSARDTTADILKSAYGDKSTFGANIQKFSPEQEKANKDLIEKTKRDREAAMSAEKAVADAADKLRADRAEGEKEAAALVAKKQKEDAAALDRSKKEVAQRNKEATAEAGRQAQAEADQRRQDALDPLGAAQRALARDAKADLRRQGAPANVAELAAPRMAELLTQGLDIQSATQQSVMEAMMKLNQAEMLMQRVRAQQNFIDQQVRRGRTVRPTNQNLPIN